MPSSGTKKTTPSSSIKGGGRVFMSDDAFDSVVSFLQSVRDETNPLLPKFQHHQQQQEQSNHDVRREQKRFLKRLVECHAQRQALSLQHASSSALKQPRQETNQRSKNHSNDHHKSTSSMPKVKSSDTSSKVRIHLVEAIVKKSKSSSQNTTTAWKEGSVRKMVVLHQHTSIEEVALQAKSKLRLKKEPCRIFCLDDKVEVDLKHNLKGIQDGAVIYVSCDKQKVTRQQEQQDDDKQKTDISSNRLPPPPDPLESVKRAYAERRQRNTKKYSTKERHINALTKTCSSPDKEPLVVPTRFSDCLHNLQDLPPSRAELPAAKYRKELLTTLDNHDVVIVCGETGCGKSTQIPQFLLEGIQAQQQASNDKDWILVSQPRRVAAMALAERVAKERSSPPPGQGNSQVGYIVRLARKITSNTKLVYCTVGILLRMLIHQDDVMDNTTRNNHELPCYLVIDEVHERDLNTDFLLMLLKTILKKRRDIKVILMSATASPHFFVQYFQQANPKVISIPGRTFPVATHYLPDCERFIKTQLNGWDTTNMDSTGEDIQETSETTRVAVLSPRATSSIDNVFLCKLIAYIVRQDKNASKQQETCSRNSGSILVFLPGKGEIDALAHTLYKDPVMGDRDKCRLYILHSKANPSEQRAVFVPAGQGRRKIVLATNVAETSITIPDVSVVIDTGRVKESRFNSSTRIKELVTVWTSQASATQRAGRAGRTGPGVCYKLYTRDFHERYMPVRTCPEMVRTPLDELVLQVCLLEESQRDLLSEKPHANENILGTCPVLFLKQAPEPPPESQVLFACQHLLEASALSLISPTQDLSRDTLFRLSPLGYHLSNLPMDAKVGKVLIVGCILECIEPSLTIAAALCCPKACWLKNQSTGRSKRQEAQESDKNVTARDLHKDIIRNGFGGESWKGGTVKGDTIAMIAAYNTWSSYPNNKERRNFAFANALDHNCLCDIYNLRKQFRESLVDAGFLSKTVDGMNQSDPRRSCANDDALLTSCCLVAGLYPNIATLLRPNRARQIRGGRLTTKDGTACRPSSSSFQAERIRNASEKGKDAYTVFHSKHRTVGAGKAPSTATSVATYARQKQKECFLSEINFVSRFSILLFGGEVTVKENALVVDGWLKFKVGNDKGQKTAAILVLELRKELDSVILKHFSNDGRRHDGSSNACTSQSDECRQVMQVVRKLLLFEE